MMAFPGNVGVPRPASCLLIEFALHHCGNLAQPRIALIFRAEDQSETYAVLTCLAKAITSPVKPDACAVPRLDKCRRIHSAEVQAIRNGLSLAHQGIEAVACPERPIHGSAQPPAGERGVSASDIRAIVSIGGNHGVAFGRGRYWRTALKTSSSCVFSEAVAVLLSLLIVFPPQLVKVKHPMRVMDTRSVIGRIFR